MSNAPAGAIEVGTPQEAMALTEAQVQEAIDAEVARAEGLAADPTNTEGAKDDTETAATSGGTVEGEQPKGIATADGNSIIPFSVLQESRRREAEAREQAAEAARTADKLREDLARLQQGSATDEGTTAAETDAVAEATDDRIAKLKEQADAIRDDLPAMATLFDNLIAEVEESRKVRDSLERREIEAKQSAEKSVAEQVRAVIDNNPTLVLWESTNVEAFNRAADFDDMLKKDPLYKGVSLEDRFAKAVELTKAVMPNAQTAPAATATPDAKTLKERADKALAEAGEFTPNTLSDLPGGASPSGNALDNLESISAAALANRMEKMTPEQLTDFLARHG